MPSFSALTKPRTRTTSVITLLPMGPPVIPLWGWGEAGSATPPFLESPLHLISATFSIKQPLDVCRSSNAP